MKYEYPKYIESHPQVCHGKPCFKGTRIPVSLILAMIEGGDSIEDVQKGYPQLSKRAVQAALHLAGEIIDRKMKPRRAA